MYGKKMFELLFISDYCEGETILHKICSRGNDSIFTHERITIIEIIFDIFKRQHNLPFLMKFLAKKDNKNQIPILFLLIQDSKVYDRLIWKYLSILMITPNSYLQELNPKVIFSMKKFAEKFRLFEQILIKNFSIFFQRNKTNDVFKCMVRKYETQKLFMICNFVGKYKQKMIPGFNRFTI
jgi:hypothetical protein